MKSHIIINHGKIPYQVIEDLEKTLKDKSISVTITCDEEKYSNLYGSTGDILVYIDQHLTELFINGIAGLIGTAFYDGIKTLMKNIKTYYSKEKKDVKENKNYVSLNFEIKPDKTIIYNFEGIVDDNIIENQINNIFVYLRDKEKQNQDFQNPDYKSRDNVNSTINMKYNANQGSWEPFNYSEHDKWYAEESRKIDEECDN